MFSEIAEIALVAARLGQFLQFLKTRVILILNFTRPHAITNTNSQRPKRLLIFLVPTTMTDFDNALFSYQTNDIYVARQQNPKPQCLADVYR